MPKLKITTIGASAGLILNKAVMTRLRVKKGDSLYLTEAPGGFRVTPYDPEFEKKMAKADDIISRYRNTLHVLAK